jgi:mannose/cellobiose epimerase-like protein (N-acyl-D-glucosamine 2-epimerase family)
MVHKYVKTGQLVSVQGLYTEAGEAGVLRGDSAQTDFVARTVHLLGSEVGQYNFEKTQWWVAQIEKLANRWLDMLFGDKRSYEAEDFAKFYRTNWNIIGLPGDDNIQETATLSRLIYGLSSAYLLTGNDRYYRAAKAGVEYQRETYRSISHDNKYCFWAFGKRKYAHNKTMVVTPSENPDDAGAVPLYEQIYALAGLTQFYRITNDWDVLEDIHRTIKSFNKFFLGPLTGDEQERKKAEEDPLFPQYKDYYGGYFSHIDYFSRKYDSPSLGKNNSRKNWNSVGDHIPAYLVNLLLSLDPIPTGREVLKPFVEEYRKMLVATSQLIVDRFPDPDPKIPYVNERFYADWSPDHQWSWQQNRAVVGHNLKIAWNLTRVANYFHYLAEERESQGETAQAEYWRALAEGNMRVADQLGQDMVHGGLDLLRGGCFDTVEREPKNGLPIQFAWGNTKDFWQQEQAILAYLILHGCTTDDDKRDEYLELARECAAVWNLFFLDQDQIGVRFRVNDLGEPVVEGSYASKGGHSISGYHAFELNYLAHIYTRAYVTCSGSEL